MIEAECTIHKIHRFTVYIHTYITQLNKNNFDNDSSMKRILDKKSDDDNKNNIQLVVCMYDVRQFMT